MSMQNALGFKNIQIKIALSVEKVHILINILEEGQMSFDLGDEFDIR